MRINYFFIIATGLLFSSCFFNSEIKYTFENNKGLYEFQATNPDTIIKNDVSFWTTELNTGDEKPIQINFIYSEATPNVQKLKSITTSLLASDGKGNFQKLPSKSALKIEYWDGKYQSTFLKENNVEPLNQLVDCGEK